MQDENEEIKEVLEELSEQIADKGFTSLENNLFKNVEKLREENKLLKIQNGAQAGTIDYHMKLLREREQLSESWRELAEQKTKQVDQLQAENRQLLTDNMQVRAELGIAWERVQVLEAENSKLRAELAERPETGDEDDER